MTTKALPRQFLRFALHCGELRGHRYMIQVLIQQYLKQMQDLRKVSGIHREMVVREAFKKLLKGWARSHDLTFFFHTSHHGGIADREKLPATSCKDTE